MSDSALIICFDSDDNVSAMVRTKTNGVFTPRVLAKALHVASRTPTAEHGAGAVAAHIVAVFDRMNPALHNTCIENVPAALSAAILADDYSDFEGETPEETWPTCDAGIYIVDVSTGDVVVKSGYNDGDDFNALTDTTIIPAA